MRTAIFCCALALAGCAASTPPAPQIQTVTKVIDTACDWVKPITASKADTLETKRQILAHDLALA